MTALKAKEHLEVHCRGGDEGRRTELGEDVECGSKIGDDGNFGLIAYTPE